MSFSVTTPTAPCPMEIGKQLTLFSAINAAASATMASSVTVNTVSTMILASGSSTDNLMTMKGLR